MQYYKISFSSVPKIWFAHKYETTDYSIHLPKRKNTIEVFFAEEGDFSRTDETSKTTQFSTPCIGIHTFLSDSHISSTAPLVRHFTFSLVLDNPVMPISNEEIIGISQNKIFDNENPLVAIFPEIITDKNVVDIIEKNIKQLIYHFSPDDLSKQLFCVGYALQILSTITDYSINQAIVQSSENIFYSDINYCNRAIAFITENIQKKILVSEIAEYLGISTGHLSRIFKTVTGCTLVEYINIKKINLTKLLLSRKDIKIFDVASQIGISDEKYFYRLFKKHTGMTVNEYKKLLKHNPLIMP